MNPNFIKNIELYFLLRSKKKACFFLIFSTSFAKKNILNNDYIPIRDSYRMQCYEESNC